MASTEAGASTLTGAPPASWRARLVRVAEKVVFWDDACVLRMRRERSPRPHPEFSLVEYRTFVPRILAVNESFDRGFAEARLRLRFDRGLRFYELAKDGQTLGTVWLIPGGERFLDEPGAALSLGEGGLSFRDIFVAPRARGGGVFEALFDAVLAQHPECRALWGVVNTSNRSSLRAHEKYGFSIVARYQVVHLAGTVMLRIRWPRRLFSSGFKLGRRVLLTGPRFHRFVSERIA